MKFINFKGDILEERVTSIVLEYDAYPQTPPELKIWICPNCANRLFQYAGRFLALIPGKIETELPILVECDRCKRKYLIVSIVSVV